MKNKSFIPFTALASLLGMAFAVQAETVLSVSRAPTVPYAGNKATAALFVADQTPGGACVAFLPAFTDKLAAALNKTGFSVVRPEDSLDLGQRTEEGRAQLFQKVEEGSRNSLNESSKIQLARDLGADCYLDCAVSGTEISEVVAGVKDIRVDVSMSLYGAAVGDGLYGDTISLTVRETGENLANNMSAVLSKALQNGAEKLAASFASGIKSVDARSGTTATVKFTAALNANAAVLGFREGEGETDNHAVVDAVVIVDGAAMGTTANAVTLPAGLHQLRVEYPFCIPYVTRARFVDGQTYHVDLKMSDAGLARYRNTKLWDLAYKNALDFVEAEKRAWATDDTIKNMQAKGREDRLMKKLESDHAEWMERVKAQTEADVFWREAMNYAIRSDADARKAMAENNWCHFDKIINEVAYEGIGTDQSSATGTVTKAQSK